MEQYISKSTLVAEIKRLKNDAHNGVSYHQSRQSAGLNNELSTWEHLESAFYTVLKILDTLEVKEVKDDRLFSELWKPADGNDLPEYEREVIALYQPGPLKLEKTEYCVSFAHRPNPKGWDGKSILTGMVEHYTPKTYGKGGWNIPDVKWWLDLDFPNES